MIRPDLFPNGLLAQKRFNKALAFRVKYVPILMYGDAVRDQPQF